MRCINFRSISSCDGTDEVTVGLSSSLDVYCAEIRLKDAEISMGATRSDIVVQFFVESVTLTLSGRLVGICFGGMTMFFISRLAGWYTLIQRAIQL